ncbi:hypothetical protein H2200_011328 [Cladophialophora chaetospira]|uniref:Uncharacterized protein n=1 Tax=Cladophialophora chaetospira TaxID=386627 RepID=A0AA39CDS8_9EURO|nr:hypothetical protein H2200_011328 [Cladophialophora chaetospira]
MKPPSLPLCTPHRTGLSTPYFFVAALYRSHHQHIETHRNTIDDAIQSIERQTGFGRPGRLENRRPSFDDYPNLVDPKSVIQQLSFCQTDLAIIGHVARCCLDCGEWLVGALEGRLSTRQQRPPHEGERQDVFKLNEQDQQTSQSLKTIRLMIREDVEYMRRRTAMLLSQVQQMRERVQSQTGFMLNTIMQSDAEYTAAIAVDGKRDSIAMKTIAVLGIIFLPGTFVATLFSINMFDWGFDNNGESASLSVSRSMWIYWAITVPLTVVTFLVWVLWSRRENQKSSKRLKIYRSNSPAESDCAAAIKISGLVVGEKAV